MQAYSSLEEGGTAAVGVTIPTSSTLIASSSSSVAAAGKRMMSRIGAGVDNSSGIMDDVTYKSTKSSRSHSRTVTSELEEPLNDVELGPRDNSNNNTHDNDDPFYVLREDLYRKLELVDESLAEFLRIVYQTDTAVNSHELKDVKKQLKRHIKNAESTLKDVKTTLTVVENDRIKFAHIDNTELYDRRSLVHTSQDRLGRAKADMTSETVKAKLLQDERSKVLRRTAENGNNNNNNGGGGGTFLGARNDSERENTAFIADSQARTSLLFQQQEETLEDLDDAVLRVGRMAETIHEEIDVQNKMLSELDDDLADAEEQLGVVMGKLAKLLKTKSKWQIGTILILTLTAIILFFLVIYS